MQSYANYEGMSKQLRSTYGQKKRKKNFSFQFSLASQFLEIAASLTQNSKSRRSGQ